jgi:hypothetical protein
MIGGFIGKSIGEPIRRTALQIVTTSITPDVAVSRAISITITAALMSLSAVISTLRRHPGKPLLFRNSGGKRGYWRGSR